MLKRLCSATLMAFVLGAPQAVAAEENVLREDLYYAGLLGTTLNHRSIGTTTNEAAWSQAVTLVAGGHISERFHAEFRAGGGFNKGSISDDLKLQVDYFASWYIGMHYPLTEYANGYAQFGFSHISGKATLDNADLGINRQFRHLEGDYPESSFSVSWLAGIDFEVIDNAYVVLEGGRLFKDTVSEANTFQFSTGVRYEF